MMHRTFISLAALAASFASAAQPAASEFERWSIAACTDARELGDVVYEKSGAETQRFARFDWQQLGCWARLDNSGKEPLGVVEYYYALRRSDYTDSPQGAQRLPFTTGLGAEAYRLYFKRLDGRWSLVAYQPTGNNLSTILSQNRTSGPVLVDADFRDRKGTWEVAVKAMESLTQVPANTKCGHSGDGKVICAPQS
jgi:hypothetical protein